MDSGPDGSRFTVALPLDRPQPAPLPDPTVATAATGVAQRQLLSVEDNPSNQALIRTLVERRPHWRLHEAASLAQAHAHLQHATPDLILLDLHLSDGNGEDLLQALRAQPHTAAIPVVVISADATATTLARVQGDPVRAYLTKPLDVADFFSILDRHLA